MRPARAARIIPLAWALAAFVGLAVLSGGPGISREEAGVLASAGAVPDGAGASPGRSPLPAAVARAGEAVSVRLGLPHLQGYRIGSALAAGLLAALLAMLALDLGGPAAAVLAPALLLAAPRLSLPLIQAGPRAAGAALVLASLLAYRRALLAARRPARLASALAGGALFGLALAFQLENAQLLAVLAAHALLLPPLLALRPAVDPVPTPAPGYVPWDVTGPTPRSAWPEPSRPPEPRPSPPLHPRSSLAAILSMVVLGPTLVLASWPWLWTDTLHRAGAAVAAVAGPSPVLYLGRLVGGGRPPFGYPLVETAFALPASLALTFAAGVLHALWRLARAVRAPRQAGGERSRAALSDDLLLVLAAAGPFVAAQLGFFARAPGPGPWLAAFPVLAALGARAIVDCAAAWSRDRSWIAATVLALAALAPAVTASLRSWPELGSSWGELAGGTPGAATLELPRHDGEAAATLLRRIAERARPGARVHWGSIPPAALAVYAADGLLRPDLVTAPSPADADVVLVPVAGSPREEEYRAWAALRGSTPVAGAFLDDVPLSWVYARPGAWR